MDGLDAPQWTDFTASPQMSDDFFIRQHPEHELEYNTRFKQNRLKYKEKPLFLTDDENGFDTVLDKVQITPVKVLSPNKNNKDDKVPKETTVGNLLLEAMNNLELSTKKKRLNQSMANSSINKTPQMTDKRITRSMKASMNFESISLETTSKEKQNETPRKKVAKNILNEVSKVECTTTTIKIENIPEQSMEPQIMTETEADGNLLPDIIMTSNLSKSADSKEEEIQTLVETVIETKISYETSNFDEPTTSKSQDNDDIDSTFNDSKLKPSKFVTSWSKPNMKKFNDAKETKKLTNPAPKKRIQVVANSIRRKSILKLKSNDQYKSMAESVSKFQKETPKRFHSVPTKTAKQPQTTKQPAMKITRPVSPNLTSKNRIRPIRVQDNKTQNPTIKKLHNGPIKADPKAISSKSAKFQKPKKIETYESKKGQFSSTESLSSTSQINHQDSHSKLDHSIHKKLVPTIVSTDDAKLAVKEVEIGHFGIPTDTNHKPKKFTRAAPFSFETRNKELQQKKELDAKRKHLQQLEKNEPTNAKEFLKKKITPIKTTREVLSTKKTTPKPFSFEERDKQLIKKKEHLLKETIEKEKKVREFHANPLPQFRPVIVRGRSRENLRSCEKTPEKQHHHHQPSIPKVCTIKKSLFPQKFANQENEPIGKLTRGLSNEKLHPNNNQTKKVILGELKLNTDKRARERKEYEDRVRMKELQEEELRKKQEEERLIREKAEIAELRKMTETKARPVPKFKPLAIIKSTKILTDPQSPAWAYKNKKF